MNLLLIEIDNNMEKLRCKLRSQMSSFKNEGMIIEDNLIDKSLLSYSVKIETVENYPISDFVNMFNYCVANAIWEYIQSYEEPLLLKKIIDEEFYYFEESEREEIVNVSMDILREDNKISILTREDSRKNKVIKQIMDYLKENKMINLKGFMTFRLRDYYLELEDTIEKAIEDFLMDREYNEFIKLLKYFVDIQDSKIDVIHIKMDEDEKKYKLYDKENKLIDNQYLNEVAKEVSDYQYLSYEDLMLSTLITMAPSLIYIHKTVGIQQEIMNTIGKVFTNKVKICNGCEWCNMIVKNYEK